MRFTPEDFQIKRPSGLLANPFTNEDHETYPLSPLDGTSTPMHTTLSFWRNAVAVTVAELTCGRGAWNVLGQMYVGIQRKARFPRNNKRRNIGYITTFRVQLWLYPINSRTMDV